MNDGVFEMEELCRRGFVTALKYECELEEELQRRTGAGRAGQCWDGWEAREDAGAGQGDYIVMNNAERWLVPLD